MDGNGAKAALDSFTRQMRRLPAALRKSMTYDRGSEMARRLKIDIWFCYLHAPWQRGTGFVAQITCWSSFGSISIKVPKVPQEFWQ